MFSLFKKNKNIELDSIESSNEKSNFKKIHKPQNCLVGFTLPLTKNDFQKDLDVNTQKDFAKSLLRSNSNYRGLNNIGASEVWGKHCDKTINALLKDIENTGVHVMRNFKLEDLKHIVTYDVFVLVGHYEHKLHKTELFDGLYDSIEIVNNIPSDFHGIIELSICNSANELLDEIKKSRQCTVIGNEFVTIVEYRLTKTKLIFQHLNGKSNNYINMLTKYSLK